MAGCPDTDPQPGGHPDDPAHAGRRWSPSRRDTIVAADAAGQTPDTGPAPDPDVDELQAIAGQLADVCRAANARVGRALRRRQELHAELASVEERVEVEMARLKAAEHAADAFSHGLPEQSGETESALRSDTGERLRRMAKLGTR